MYEEEKATSFFQVDSPFNTIIHGELWEKNMLFGEIINEEGKAEVKSIILDWKNAKIASATKVQLKGPVLMKPCAYIHSKMFSLVITTIPNKIPVHYWCPHHFRQFPITFKVFT